MRRLKINVTETIISGVNSHGYLASLCGLGPEVESRAFWGDSAATAVGVLMLELPSLGVSLAGCEIPNIYVHKLGGS